MLEDADPDDPPHPVAVDLHIGRGRDDDLASTEEAGAVAGTRVLDDIAANGGPVADLVQDPVALIVGDDVALVEDVYIVDVGPHARTVVVVDPVSADDEAAVLCPFRSSALPEAVVPRDVVPGDLVARDQGAVTVAAHAELAVVVDDVAAHSRAVTPQPDPVVVADHVVLDDPASAAFVVYSGTLGLVGRLLHDKAPDGDTARGRLEDGRGVRLLDGPSVGVVAQEESGCLEIRVEPAWSEVVGVEHSGERHAVEEHVLGLVQTPAGALTVCARIAGQERGGHPVLARPTEPGDHFGPTHDGPRLPHQPLAVLGANRAADPVHSRAQAKRGPLRARGHHRP